MDRIRKLLLDRSTYESIAVIEEHTPPSEEDHANPIESHQTTWKRNVLEDNIMPPSYFKTCIPDATITARLGPHVLSDLEILQAYSTDALQLNVIDQLGSRHLIGSRFILEHLVSHPIADAGRLMERQTCLKHMTQQFIANPNVETTFKRLKAHEEDICWLFSETQNDLSSLYDMAYVNHWLLGRLNKNDTVLTSYNLYRIVGSPIIGIVSPIVYFIVPYLVLRIKMNVKLSFMAYLKLMMQTFFMSASDVLMPSGWSKLKYVSYGFTLLFYFQSLFNSFEMSRAIYKLSKLLTERVNGIVTYIQQGYTLVEQFWQKDIPQAFSMAMEDLPTHVPYFEGLHLSPFSLFANFGKQLSIFKYLKKDAYIPLFRRIYMLDVLHTLASVVQRPKHAFCFADYANATQTPILDAQSIYHPCLELDTIVTNNITMGTEGNPPNVILTGPNAGGKSTLIKSMMIGVVLSQTLTLANASSWHFAPFAYINTQINIPDCKGKQSLFEAEMYRSKGNFDVIKSIEPTSPIIIAMDEIFSSTNPIEGIAGAYAIAKKLAEYPNVMCVLSTHYVYLTKLASTCRTLFARYKMNVVLNEQGNVVSYPYKLFKGVSRQYVALELLRKNGFDMDIIEEAIQVKDKLTKGVELRSMNNEDDKRTTERSEHASNGAKE